MTPDEIDEFDKQAREAAAAYARRLAADANRMHDRRVGAVTGIVLTPLCVIAAALAAYDRLWWFTVFFILGALVICICSAGMVQGWDYEQENDES
uniref:Membrane protein n=1 Tax=Mycobacterium phage Farewell TaxID=3158893 RepID=A0AAU8GP70_9CAUD